MSDTSRSRLKIPVLVALLGALAGIEPFSVDMTLPAMPAIARGLMTSDAQVQISLSALMLGMAVAQPFLGPLSDRFGRRPILLGAALVYIAASIGSALAPDIASLTGWRLVQGCAAAAGQVVVRAVVRDLYEREAAARLLSYIYTVFTFAPILAPIAGAHLTAALGWRSVFVALAVYAAVFVLLAAWLLRETLPARDISALNPGRLLRNYRTVAGNRMFWAYLACSSAAMAGLFAFLAGSAPVIISYLGATPENFGYLFALVMATNLVGLVAGARLVERVGLDRMLLLGTVAAAASGALMAGLAWAGIVGIAAIIVPASLYMASFALILPQATAGALTPFPTIAGAASSLLGLVQMSAAALAGALVGWSDDGTQLAMTNMIFVCAMAGLAGYGAVALTRGARAR